MPAPHLTLHNKNKFDKLEGVLELITPAFQHFFVLASLHVVKAFCSVNGLFLPFDQFAADYWQC